MPGHPDSDRRSLELTKLVVEKIDADPSLVEIGRGNLARGIGSGPQLPRQPDLEWTRLLNTHAWSELRAMLLEESDEGQRLRSSHPFTGIITREERQRIYAMHRP